MRKLVVLITVVLSVVITTGAVPHLVVIPDSIIDVGEFEERKPQTREFYIKNTGDEPLTILKVFSGCSCTRVNYSPVPVAPGDSLAMTVTLDGRNRRPGPIKKVLRITTNADNNIVNILVKGEIVKPFQN